jgi:hypothetical protein
LGPQTGFLWVRHVRHWTPKMGKEPDGTLTPFTHQLATSTNRFSLKAYQSRRSVNLFCRRQCGRRRPLLFRRPLLQPGRATSHSCSPPHFTPAQRMLRDLEQKRRHVVFVESHRLIKFNDNSARSTFLIVVSDTLPGTGCCYHSIGPK